MTRSSSGMLVWLALLVLVLVSRSLPLSATGNDSAQLEPATAADFSAMRARARKDGIDPETITLRSGFRSGAAKHLLAEDVVRVFGKDDLTKWIASRSEHITGKAIDLDLGIPNTISNVDAGRFKQLPAYKWLRVHAREHGFNQAFPGEPWHFTHFLSPGSVEGPAPGTVRPSLRGTVYREAPDTADASPMVLAARVLGGKAVAWLPALKTIVYTRCWREEGGGDGCEVRWDSRRDHKVTRTSPVFLPGEADTADARKARLAEAQKTLAPRLRSAKVMAVGYWAPEPMVNLAGGDKLSWDPVGSTLSLDGKAPLHVPRLAPWVATPNAVYTNHALDFAVVEMVYDPQEAFTSGANLVSRFEIVEGVAPKPDPLSGLPKDVADFVSRAGACSHWGGEEGYNEERRKDIEAAVKKARCEQLDFDERKLRAKYTNSAKIIAAINAALANDAD